MTRYNPIPGYTGSEIERATMVSGIFPVETALIRTVKQQVAKGLTRLANYIDPAVVHGFESREMGQRC